MPATEPTKRVLAFRSGNFCAYPLCRTRLVADYAETSAPTTLGQAAHIRGEEPGAARYDASQTDAQRNAVENLIYLCPTHHVLIDSQIAAHPVSLLAQWKESHERRMAEASFRTVAAEMARVGFAELAVLLDHIVEAGPAQTEDLRLTPLADKIELNRLSATTRQKIALGLGRAPDVGTYLQANHATPNLAKKVISTFRSQYELFVGEGLEPDAIFDALHLFASGGSEDIRYLTAGLAVEVYLFEACEIFKREAS